MAVNLGLILGSALAGGVAGAGGAAEEMGQTYQKQQGQQDLVRMQNELDEQKQMRIQESAQTFAREQQGALFAQQDKTLKNTQDFEGTQKGLDRTSEEKRTGMNNATSIATANISAGATLGAERMRINAQKDIIGKPQLIQTENGPMLLDPSTGKAAPVTGPDNKPVGGMKMTQIDQVAYQGAQKIVLDPLSTDEQKQAAQAQIQSIANKYSAAGTTGSGGAGQKAPVLPSDKAIKSLKANPALKTQFDQQFGQGAADKVLNTGNGSSGLVNANAAQPAAPPATPTTPTIGNSNVPVGVNARNPAPTPAVPPPAPANPSPAPYQPSALIAGAMTPQQGPPPTQPQFRQQLDAFGRPVQQTQNPLGL